MNWKHIPLLFSVLVNTFSPYGLGKIGGQTKQNWKEEREPCCWGGLIEEEGMVGQGQKMWLFWSHLSGSGAMNLFTFAFSSWTCGSWQSTSGAVGGGLPWGLSLPVRLPWQEEKKHCRNGDFSKQPGCPGLKNQVAWCAFHFNYSFLKLHSRQASWIWLFPKSLQTL